MPATGPHCPNLPLLPLEVPACQGLQGVFHGYLTPAEAAALGDELKGVTS